MTAAASGYMPMIFALNGSRVFGRAVASELGLALAEHEEREFEDGEAKLRPLVSVRGREVYVIHSLFAEPGRSVNDKLCRLLIFIGALKDADAAQVTAISPYLAYARKDRRTKAHDPVSARYVAQLFEAVGTDRIVALEVQNPAAYDNAFRRPAIHLEAHEAFVDALMPHLRGREPVVVSPDTGGAKRAERLRELLSKRLGRDLSMAFMEKHRSEGVISGELLVGEVSGRLAIVVDDLISSGSTLLRAVRACAAQGASGAIAVVTHGLFATGAEALFEAPELERLLVTDSCAPRMQDRWQGRVERVTVAPLVARAIEELSTPASS